MLRGNALITAKYKPLLALLLCCALLFCACQSEPTDSLHDLTQTPDGEFIQRAAELYTLVIPATASSSLVSEVNRLADNIATRTETPTDYCYDDQLPERREHEKRIFLGNTAFSELHLKSLKRDDYLCVLENGDLFLGGKTDAATIAAIERFRAYILPYADAELLINTDQCFSYQADYPIKEVLLNGYPLTDYTILCPAKAENGEQTLASLLRDQLADSCGAYLPIVTDDSVSHRIISLDAFSQPSQDLPAIRSDGSVIRLCGTTDYELACLVAAFCDMLFPEEAPEQISLSLPSLTTVECGTPETTFLPLILRDSTHSSPSDLTEIAAVADALANAGAALAPLARTTKERLSLLQGTITGYEILNTSQDDTYCLPLLYRKDALSYMGSQDLLPESGTLTAHRFLLPNTELTFTLLHGYAATEKGWGALLTAIQAYEKAHDEPVLVALTTPTGEGFSTLPEADVLWQTTVTDSTQRLTLACFAKSGEAIVSPMTNAEDEKSGYRFRITHPYLYS